MTQNQELIETEIGMIPKDWNLLTLDDIKNQDKKAIISGPFGSNISRKFFVDSGVPVIRGNNLSTGMDRFIDDGFVFITTEKANELNTWAQRDDLVFTAAGTLGQVGIIEEKSKYEKYIISNKQLRLRVNRNMVKPLFAFYWFSSSKIVKIIEQRNTGSTIPLINLSVLKSLPIVVPHLSEQVKITKILSALDEKIELNRQMNTTLEAIGQALFKHWFVDFEFPNKEGKPYKSSGGKMEETELGEVPVGWEVKPIDQIADFLNGLALQKFPPKGDEYLPVIKIRELRQGITESSDKASSDIDEKYVIDDGDVLFSWSGSLTVCIWCGGKGALNQYLFKVTSQNYPKWFNYQWIQHYLPEFQYIAAGKATTMGHIKRHHLSETLVVVPPETLMVEINGIMDRLFNKYIQNSIESRNLVTIRDALLPKLMSGEIRVNHN